MKNNWDKWGDKAIRKDNLQIGLYYSGICRNARIARWDGQKFIYWRFKFGRFFLEDIEYWDVDGDFDGFIPIFELGIELPKEIDYVKYNTPVNIKFILNGTLGYSNTESITYERICELTNLNPKNNPTITVAYPDGKWPDHSIIRGQYVIIIDGCIINACYTGNA